MLYDAYSFDVTDYFQFQSRKTIPECLLLHLKNVKIYGFRKTRLEVELLQFLIKNGKLLENMYICWQREDFQCISECCERQEIVDEEFSLLVTSPNAELISVESEEEFFKRRSRTGC